MTNLEVLLAECRRTDRSLGYMFPVPEEYSAEVADILAQLLNVRLSGRGTVGTASDAVLVWVNVNLEVSVHTGYWLRESRSLDARVIQYE